MNEQIMPVDYIGPPAAAADQPDLEKLVRRTAKRKLITTMTLTTDTCKWPFGDPATSDFYYCGQLPQDGRPYCDKHNALSYQSAKRKTRSDNASAPGRVIP